VTPGRRLCARLGHRDRGRPPATPRRHNQIHLVKQPTVAALGRKALSPKRQRSPKPNLQRLDMPRRPGHGLPRRS